LLPQAREDDGDGHEARLSLMALLQIQSHLHAASSYLSSLNQADDESGTRQDAYPLDALELQQLTRELRAGQSPWAKAMAEECHAAELMAQGLRCLSTQRNQQAAQLLQRLLKEHPQSLVL